MFRADVVVLEFIRLRLRSIQDLFKRRTHEDFAALDFMAALQLGFQIRFQAVDVAQSRPNRIAAAAIARPNAMSV